MRKPFLAITDGAANKTLKLKVALLDLSIRISKQLEISSLDKLGFVFIGKKPGKIEEFKATSLLFGSTPAASLEVKTNVTREEWGEGFFSHDDE